MSQLYVCLMWTAGHTDRHDEANCRLLPLLYVKCVQLHETSAVAVTASRTRRLPRFLEVSTVTYSDKNTTVAVSLQLQAWRRICSVVPCRKTGAHSLGSLSVTLEVPVLQPAHRKSQNESRRAGTDSSKLSAFRTPERYCKVAMMLLVWWSSSLSYYYYYYYYYSSSSDSIIITTTNSGSSSSSSDGSKSKIHPRTGHGDPKGE